MRPHATLVIAESRRAPGLVPVSILRYRLDEIDRIISRTPGWALSTRAIGTIFAGLIVALQALLAPLTHESTLAVAVSTLAAFALFQPLRRRVQAVVDHRFNRARYGAEQVVSGFVTRLRGQVELGAVIAEVGRAAERTVAPTSTAVWLKNLGRDQQ